MDTISRENNSMIPVAGIIVGVLALIVGGYAAIKVSSLQKVVTAQEEKVAKIDGIESQLGQVAATADKASKDLSSLSRSTQDAVTQIGNALSEQAGRITKIEEAQKKPVAVKGGKGGAPAVAGPDEYIVKSGDGGAKIARANGVSLTDLMAVNPDVNWKKLHPGQKIKLPAKK
ncbi:MAG: LysM peptidoglycan-binding domain-containing protein [Verrucomicrobia bacterium]|nr:LysM peptidoglycan-binding domain-containing protein [Verrucomicrobiota bacterium]